MLDVNKIMEYEAGTLSEMDTLNLFAEIVNGGYHRTLQGHYGRTANSLMEAGLLRKDEDGQWIVDMDTWEELV